MKLKWLAGFRGSSDTRTASAGQLNAVLADLARRLKAGEQVDSAAVERAHPNLMPELGERLRDLHILKSAVERVKSSTPSEARRDAWDGVLEEELRLLRRELTDYEVLERLRYGGQGVVYRARQRGTDRIVAVKLLLDGPLASDRQRYRFEREIELVSRLRHPGIVTVFGSGAVRGRPYFAMEFVEGMPIDDFVVLHDLTAREIVRLVVDVCRAVHYAHQNGVIHRDLSPANILVDTKGSPRVFDFGLATDLWETEAGHPYSFTGQVIGTLPYLSPEQAGGLDGKVDVRSDVYMLGVVLYELLTDSFPYTVVGEPQIVRSAITSQESIPLRKAIATGRPDRAPGVETINRDLEVILTKTLTKAKEDRYQSAAHLADDLARWLAGDAVSARAGSRMYMLRKALRRHRMALTAAAVILLAVGLSSAAVTTSWLHARAQRDNARKAAHVAFDLFDMAQTDIDESVRPLPGGVAVRDRLVQRLSDQMPMLEALAESDVELESIRIRLLEQQGDIAHQQGRRTEAQQYYRQFLADCRSRLGVEPIGTHVADAIRAHRRLAEVSDDPLAEFERGIEAAQAVVEAYGRSPGVQYELCQLHLSMGRQLQICEEYERALSHFERGLVLCETSEKVASADARWSRLMATALHGKGRILHQLGIGAPSIEALERSAELRNRIVEASPVDTEARSELLASYRHLGTWHRDIGEFDKAKDYLRRATEHSEFLAVVDPSSTEWDGDRYSAHHRLAALCLRTGELQEAAVQCERALAIAERWAGRDDSREAQEHLSHAHILQGRIHLSRSACAEARTSFENALAVRATLLEQEPNDSKRISQLATAHDWLAVCDRKLADFESMLEHRLRSLDCRQRVADLQPGVVAALNLIGSQANLAAAYMVLDTAAHDAIADRLLTEASETLDKLKSEGKLAGWEHHYQEQSQAIQQNQRMLHERDLEGTDRTTTSSSPPFHTAGGEDR